MRYLPGEEDLLLKAVRGSRVTCNVWEYYLQCDVNALQKAVFNLVNFSHSTSRNETNYDETVRDHLSRLEAARRRSIGNTRVFTIASCFRNELSII